ncbi:hypothetical protein EIP91_001452 [Steccherinum ochraceum]|uniref:Ubiquitin carboxyl-terminal hydrolase 14 n=1 Tax=Steccherinum ochraceum TaxID=92696 RepID=A0A4R0RR84_9APHY|nr:hypothetical protein EIP91_001452 [Steccherinum ochraceum]
MTSCPHLNELKDLQPPRLSQSVHREECTQCFDNQDQPLGIDVCLHCFNGGCLDHDRHHMRTHLAKSGHSFTLNVKRKLRPSSNRAEDEEPPAKMTKLAIVEERDEDKYEYKTTLKCWKCLPETGLEVLEVTNDAHVQSLVKGVMQSLSSARQSEVKAWQEELTACEHTLTLEQLATGHILESGLAHCSQCELKENLWLCLTCGSLGCGRQQFGGVGGNGHGLQHYEQTQHPVSVKLGTITPEGGADIYCYACNEERVDLELAAHLATFGINVQTQTKTEKSLTELQIEQNLKFDFSLTGEDGKALEPVFGPGLTGLANLGNSCYMASVMQSVFSLPSFRSRYLSSASQHAQTCTVPLPADCLDCQLHKLADGLLSGRYSHPRPTSDHTSPKLTNPLAHDSPTPVFQEGVRPSSFKALIGKGHEEFSTMRQQDSEEFFSHLVTVIRRNLKKSGKEAEDPTEVFKFGMEQKLQCNTCHKVRYRIDPMDVASVPVPKQERGKDADGKTIYEDIDLLTSLKMFTGVEDLEYNCPSCEKRVTAYKRSNFSTFPQVLVIHARRFQLVNWVPTKLEIPVILPSDDILHMGEFLGHGLQLDETLLPDDLPAAPALPEFNAAAMAQLEGMGFPAVRCQKALLATGNSDPNVAMEWLFQHMDDADIDAPIQLASAVGNTAEPSAEQISMLADMGFSAPQAKKALRETGGDAERAVDWLFSHPDDMGDEPTSGSDTPAQVNPGPGGSPSLPATYKLKAFISHKGPSVHSGHYVAHIRAPDPNSAGDSWVLFNDEKVVKADAESVKELKKLAYLYIFEKKEIAELYPNFQERITAAWSDLLGELEKGTAEIASKGSEVVPQVEFSQLQQLSAEEIATIRQRGCVVIRNVVDDAEATGWRKELQEFVKSNPVIGFPEDDKQFFQLYWTRPQVRARGHPNVLQATSWLNSMYRSKADAKLDGVDLSTPLTYADRFRLRHPGNQWNAHPPHVDGGSIERWEDSVFRTCFTDILSGEWRTHDPYDLEGRINARTSLYGRENQSSIFRTYQGWLAVSETAPHEGTLKVFPNVILSNAYTIMRPFFRPTAAPESPDFLHAKSWEYDISSPDFPGIYSIGKGFAGPRPNTGTHPHMRLNDAMDVVHAVEVEHVGKEDSCVMYIPAVPSTPQNMAYVHRQKESFLAGIPPPDFPRTQGESNFVGLGTLEDIESLIGKKAMGVAIPVA